MSPTESDLRAALRAGDSDGAGAGGLDADQLIAGARAASARRRTRMLATAATVVVVAAAGAGTGVVLNSGGGTHVASASTAEANAAEGRAPQLHAAQPSGAGQRASSVVAAPCPPAFTHPVTAGGGGIRQFGPSGPLFAKPVSTVVVCAYGPPGPAVAEPGRLVLSGQQAAALVESLESASKTYTARRCAAPLHRNQLAITGVAADGAQVGTVVTTLTEPVCGLRVITNGAAVRFDWAPPANLEPILMALTPRTGRPPATLPSGSAPGRVHGSPIQS